MPAHPQPIPSIDAKLMCAYTEISVATYTKKLKKIPNKYYYTLVIMIGYFSISIRHFSNEKKQET